ncbi:class II aldolase/adducin family protein [Alkaliphilus serpentinus]|uniref:Class II aldolase/adducin family protein n=1 Tax=Alkaliphilus serpentinus TaxID=1482731 RepID=A0A833HN71_9FIRM|nr:class II aldolase/adducin family protein [Alkaliphilus serpentinus]KAB3529198.1 class II aldolase/adducin family protein [Alkaliphilus serpentinus]
MTVQQEIISGGRRILSSGLIKGTWGNISIRRGDTLWITPSGVPYDELEEESVAAIDMATGGQIAGNLPASSELLLHLKIYKHFPIINGIVHTHSIYASAFAALLEEVPCYTEDQAQIIGGDIPVAEYALPGTDELAENAVSALGKGRFATLMANHGLVAIGRSLKEALTAADIAEKSAQLASIILSLNKNPKPLSHEDITLLREKYLGEYSKKIIKE